MSTGLSPEQRQRFEATARILAGEDPDVVAGEVGLAPAAVRRDADDLISPEQLKSVLERMAGEHGLVGRAEFPFQLGVGAKSYRPDCVWFAERVAPETAVAIFEVEVGTSRSIGRTGSPSRTSSRSRARAPSGSSPSRAGATSSSR